MTTENNEAQENNEVKVKSRKPKLWVQIIIVYFAVYIGLSAGFAIFSPHRFDYKKFNWIQYGSTVLMQPVMEIFGNGQVSHWYDWESIKYVDEIDKTVPSVETIPEDEQIRDYSKNITWDNAIASLGKIKNTAIIEPINHEGKWRLVYCTKDKTICEKSNIVVIGEAKILIDGKMLLWGIDKDDKFLQIQIKEYIDIDKELDIILI